MDAFMHVLQLTWDAFTKTDDYEGLATYLDYALHVVVNGDPHVLDNQLVDTYTLLSEEHQGEAIGRMVLMYGFCNQAHGVLIVIDGLCPPSHLDSDPSLN